MAGLPSSRAPPASPAATSSTPARRSEPAVAAWATPGAARACADTAIRRSHGPRSILLDRAAVARRDRGAAARRSSITAPAPPTSATSWARSGTPLRGQRPRARTTCSKRCGVAGLDAAVLVTGSALVYRPSPDAIDEDVADRPVEPVRRQQARAGDARARASPRSRSFLARPFNHAGRGSRGVCDLQLRAADRRDRGRTRGAGAAASAISTRSATSPTCATPCAPTGCSPRRGTPGGPTTSAADAPTASATCWSMLLALAQDERPRRERSGALAAIGQSRDARRSPRASTPTSAGTPTIPIDRHARRTCSTTGDGASPSLVTDGRAPARRIRPADRPHRDGRLRAARLRYCSVVAGGAAGGRGARLQPVQSCRESPAQLYRPGERAARRPLRHRPLPAVGAAARLALPRPPRHRRRRVGHPGARRRHGDASSARRLGWARCARGTARSRSPARSRSSSSEAAQARCSPGGAGRT